MSEEHKQYDVEIAVLAKEMQYVGDNLDSFKESVSERLQSLTDVIKSFIEISNKKVDNDVYLEDKRQLAFKLQKMETDIAANTDYRKVHSASESGKEQGLKSIWGISQGTVSMIINFLSIITLAAAVITIFK